MSFANRDRLTLDFTCSQEKKQAKAAGGGWGVPCTPSMQVCENINDCKGKLFLTKCKDQKGNHGLLNKQSY